MKKKPLQTVDQTAKQKQPAMSKPPRKKKKTSKAPAVRKTPRHKVASTAASNVACCPNQDPNNDDDDLGEQPDVSVVGNYHFLLKKDWGEDLIFDNDKLGATDFTGEEDTYELHQLSHCQPDIPFNRDDYDLTQTNPTAIRNEVKERLGLPESDHFRQQRALLKGKRLADWKKFEQNTKEIINIEAGICNIDNVLALGWEPAVESRPTSKKNGKLKGQYLLKVC